MTKSWVPKEQDFVDFFKLPIDIESTSENEESDVTFQGKLSHLSLLYDVPFSYLVPAENMLKLHEIRFFWLDSNWVRTLLDGVCSIGRNASIDYIGDLEFLRKIYEKAISDNVNIRRGLRGKEVVKGLDPLSSCTGFLLRSPLVGGWRGLEFVAYTDEEGSEPLTPLRLETLSPEVLLGLYSGEIKRLDIKEPPEGFHYGFNRNDGGPLTKRLRSIEKGELLPGDPITIRERGNRVIDFSTVAEDIKKQLFPNSKEVVSSAHIALEMIQNPYKINIKKLKKVGE